MRVQGGKYFVNEMNEQSNHEVCFYIPCSQAYSERCQTSQWQRFTKIVNGFHPVTVFAKHSVIDV